MKHLLHHYSPSSGPPSTPSLRSSSDSIQSSSSLGSLGKGKKRERGDHGSDTSKRERLTKVEDGDLGETMLESELMSDIAKITDKGGLVDFEGVKRLVQLMQLDSTDQKIDLAGRIMLVDVIAVTDQYDCLGWFVQLKGLPILDEWLREAHKRKIGEGNMPKESDKSVEEFLLVLLRALDKLPVNLHALQSCNVGKSVNHLRSHKNSEIQKKARSLVDTWKKRVEVEMTMNDGKSGSSRAVSWQAKPALSDVSQVCNRKTGYSEIPANSSGMPPTLSKNSLAKLITGEALSKYSPSPGSTKSMPTLLVSNSKNQNIKMLAGSGTSDLPLSSIKEERSSGSSQSPNNSLSCSNEHPKSVGSCHEDARSSKDVIMSLNKNPGGACGTQNSRDGLHGVGVTVVQKELGSVRNSSRNADSEKVSPPQVSLDKLPDLLLADPGNNQEMILRLPNGGYSSARGVNEVTFAEPAVQCGKASFAADKNENWYRRLKTKTAGMQFHGASNLTTNVCDANGSLIDYEEDNGSPICNEQCRVSADGDKVAESSKPTDSLLGFISRSGQTYDASLSPMDALVESCVQFSEACGSVSPGDEGINLLASVAAGEMSRLGDVSPLASPQRKSPAAEESSSGNDDKSKHSSEAAPSTLGHLHRGPTGEPMDNLDTLHFKNDTSHPVMTMSCDLSGDGEAGSSSCIEKTDNGRTHVNLSSSELLPNSDGPFSHPKNKEVASETIVADKMETHGEPLGESQILEQRVLGSHLPNSSNDSESQLKLRISSYDDEQKVDHKEDGTMENEKLLISKAGENVRIEKESNEKSPEFVVTENQIIAGKVTDAGIPSPVAENSVPEDVKKECGAEIVDDMKPSDNKPEERCTNLDSSVPGRIDECAVSDRLEVLGHCSTTAEHSQSPRIPAEENELPKTIDHNLGVIESEGRVGGSASVTAAGSDIAVMLDFDLNEDFPVDDVSHGDIVRQEEPIASSTVNVPSPLAFSISSMSGSFHASITVASAEKGPVIPPESPLRSKGELGWKGSAATSAFRPAEPRKHAEPPSNTGDVSSFDAASLKQGRPPLDFDLNVPDQRSLEDVTFLGLSEKTRLDSVKHYHSSVGLDLDLNRVDETLETGSLPSQPLLSGGLSNGGTGSRDFDLNNGPGPDEVGAEASAHSQQMKSVVPFPSAVHGVRTNYAEFGNFSTWFPPGYSYSAITFPPLLSGRGEQGYVNAGGTQQILGSSGSMSAGPEIYRGAVLSSSPAVAYPPTTPFPYPGFPFETNFSISSNSFSSGSMFMDSSNIGGLCFPNMPSQPVGPGGAMASTSPHPRVMSFPGATSNVIPESRTWGSQNLDLNSPGGTDTERVDDRLSSGLMQKSVPNSQALIEDQMKRFQVAGNLLKRKEPDGGWDGADRFSYKPQ